MAVSHYALQKLPTFDRQGVAKSGLENQDHGMISILHLDSLLIDSELAPIGQELRRMSFVVRF